MLRKVRTKSALAPGAISWRSAANSADFDLAVERGIGGHLGLEGGVVLAHLVRRRRFFAIGGDVAAVVPEIGREDLGPVAPAAGQDFDDRAGRRDAEEGQHLIGVAIFVAGAVLLRALRAVDQAFQRGVGGLSADWRRPGKEGERPGAAKSACERESAAARRAFNHRLCRSRADARRAASRPRSWPPRRGECHFATPSPELNEAGGSRIRRD